MYSEILKISCYCFQWLSTCFQCFSWKNNCKNWFALHIKLFFDSKIRRIYAYQVNKRQYRKTRSVWLIKNCIELDFWAEILLCKGIPQKLQLKMQLLFLIKFSTQFSLSGLIQTFDCPFWQTSWQQSPCSIKPLNFIKSL